MKRFLFLFAACLTTIAALAQPEVKIEFFTPSIVHIVKGQPTKSLVITAKPEQVEVIQQGNTWKSSELIVKYDPAMMSFTFCTAKGRVLLREQGWSTIRQNLEDFKVSQTFLLDKDEAIYGLGTIQNGKMNRRGEHKRMEQSNLEDFQNVLQSVKGWGLYWENYSPTQFDDDANGMTFTSEAGNGIDYYFMYGSGSRRNAIRVLQRRKASSISTVPCRCPSTASSRTGNTGDPTTCGTPWTSSLRTSLLVRN